MRKEVGGMAENQNLQGTQIIAKIFGVSTRRVEQLKSEGVIKGHGKPTKYDLLPTIQAYIRYLSDKAYGREEKKSKADLEEQKLRAEADIKQSKAKIAEMQVKELEGKMHRSEDVEAVMTDLVYTIRSMLTALPGRLAVDVSTAGSAAEASEIMRVEVYKILDELAAYKYDPEEYARRVMDREGWSELSDSDAEDE